MEDRPQRSDRRALSLIVSTIFLLALLPGTALAAMTSNSSTAANCATSNAERLVQVATLDELLAAINEAQPGDAIVLADGTYQFGAEHLTDTSVPGGKGLIHIRTNGSPDKPITLCGSREAILDGGGWRDADGNVLNTNLIYLDSSSYWIIRGFSIKNAHRGIVVRFQSDFNVIEGIEISEIGQEAVHFGMNSNHNTIVNSEIFNIGRRVAHYGEGVYVGSAASRWCDEWTKLSCQPDRSDNNRIVYNTFGRGITAEPVDIKPGTSGTKIIGNTFDGRQMRMLAIIVSAGNDVIIRDNTGVVYPLILFDPNKNDYIYRPRAAVILYFDRVVSGDNNEKYLSGNNVIIDNNIFELKSFQDVMPEDDTERKFTIALRDEEKYRAGGVLYGVNVDYEAKGIVITCSNRISGAVEGEYHVFGGDNPGLIPCASDSAATGSE